MFSLFFLSPGYGLRFAALNLAYYLIECYTEVRRTPDDLEQTHYRNHIYSGEKKKEREKDLGHVRAPLKKTKVPKTACGFYYDRFTYPYICSRKRNDIMRFLFRCQSKKIITNSWNKFSSKSYYLNFSFEVE